MDDLVASLAYRQRFGFFLCSFFCFVPSRPQRATSSLTCRLKPLIARVSGLIQQNAQRDRRRYQNANDLGLAKTILQLPLGRLVKTGLVRQLSDLLVGENHGEQAIKIEREGPAIELVASRQIVEECFFLCHCRPQFYNALKTMWRRRKEAAPV